MILKNGLFSMKKAVFRRGEVADVKRGAKENRSLMRLTTDQKAGGSNPPGHASENALENAKIAILGRFFVWRIAAQVCKI